MLKEATLNDIAKYCDFAYSLALEQTKSCYPTYADGIKSKEDFIVSAQKAISKETSELLLFLPDNTVEGWIQYFWIPENHYLQLNACNINRETEQALTELLNLLKEHFSGYTLYFGFPECNTDAVHFLQKNDFECIENDWNNSFFFDHYEPLPENKNIIRINKENFDDFRAVYHPDEEAYWNCDRILECLENWIIFAYYQNNIPVGTIFLQGSNGYYEIFGIEFANDNNQEELCRAMLITALNHCKHIGAKYMTFLCETDSLKIVQELGFHCVGKYVCYIRKL